MDTVAHSHGHSHSHRVSETVNRAFIIGISLNLLYVIIEIIYGVSSGSLSLLSDAGHNFLDVVGLALSLLAIRLGRAPSTKRFTYGFGKTTIVVALFNATLLLISMGAITYEAVDRFIYPEPMPGNVIAIVAFIGIIINALTGFFFFREKSGDLNVKSAYLHLFLDALVAAAIVAGGIIMYYTHIFWIDPALSLLIVIVIVRSTWKLLAESLSLSLDAVPRDIEPEEIRVAAKQIPGISDIHHIHIWSLSTTENAMTAHLVTRSGTTKSQETEIKKQLREELGKHHIHHLTIEIESEGAECADEEC